MKMTIEEIIVKHKLNQSVLAINVLGIGQGTFHEKLNKKRHSKFTQPQVEKLKDYLNTLSEDIKALS